MQRRGFLRGLATSALASGAAANKAAAATPAQPNVILINCDDLGRGDLGCYGSAIRTPNIDRLAAEGTRFEHFCAASSVCSPSRAALLTGRYPTRVGVPFVLGTNDSNGLAIGEKTIGDVLLQAGYRTACIGKWHLGTRREYWPTSRGFQEYFGIPYSNDMWPRPLMYNAEVVEETAKLETLTRRYTNEALKFIRQPQSKPFFLYLAHTFPHIPLACSPAFRGRSPVGIYGDVVEELDASVGELMTALRESGLAESTMVIFTSDNGPWFQGSPGNLRGRKGSTWEGGVRVPMIAWMPGEIRAGEVTQQFGSAMDLLPTIAARCKAPLTGNPVDGIDLWPLLARGEQIDRDPVMYFNGWDLQCARWGPFKLHVSRFNAPIFDPLPAEGRINLPLPKPELYNLHTDPTESYDRTPDHPEVVAFIQAKMEEAIRTFPDAAVEAWEITRSRKVEGTPAGALPIERR